ncbi:MAG: DUF1838 family protein [Rhodobacteraceae bacterium]|nr:DUF1838 family protein [Paracoccaceae bacterium]
MNRRDVLTGMSSVGVIGSVVGSRRASAATFDPANPLDVGMAYRKLGWSADENLTMHWMQLTRYGMVDAKLSVMWESLIGILYAVKDTPPSASGAKPGDYDVNSLTLTFYFDPKTGEVMEKYNNPWTGETLDIPYGGTTPTHRRHSARGIDIDMKSPPGMNASADSYYSAWTEGDDVWVRGDLDIRMEATGSGPAEMSMGAGGTGMKAGGAVMARLMQVNDWFTYQGRLSHVIDPDNKNPPASITFNDLNTWSTWLKMGEQPGNFIGRGFGKKVFAYDDMPDRWRKLVAERYPDVAKNPEKVIKG